MTTTLTATYDGKVLVPAGELDLPRNAIVRLRVERVDEAAPAAPEPNSIWAKLRKHSGVVRDLPSDYARNHDHYLHGAPRK